MSRLVACLLGVNAVGLIACCCTMPSTANVAKATPQVQEQRRKLIQKMESDGIIQKIQYERSPCAVWVTPTFMAMNFDTKRGLCAIIFSYAFEVPANGEAPIGKSLNLFHSTTGKNVGDYDSTIGLRIH